MRASPGFSVDAGRAMRERVRRTRADPTARAREPELGLPADRRRAAQAGHRHLGQLVRNILLRRRGAAGARRDRQAGAASCARTPQSILACDFFTVDTVWLRRLYVLVFISHRHPPHRVLRAHQQTRRPLDAAAGAQPTDGARRPRPAGAVPDPRPRREVPARLRRTPRERRNQGHPHACAGAERERAHGALGRQRPPRMPRPAADPQPPPARARPPRLRPRTTTASDLTARSISEPPDSMIRSPVPTSRRGPHSM